MVILLVNPSSAGQYLSQELKAKGFFTIALFTVAHETISAYYSPSPDLFDKQIYINSIETAQLLAAIADYKIDYVLNGNDESLLITESLIEKLAPRYKNDDTKIACRIDKFYAQEAFKAHGLPYIKQLKISRSDNIHLAESIGFPCFIKPVRGAGSVGASFCYSSSELTEKLQEQLYTPLHHLMDEYIIQEIIKGREIVVDTFSVNGQHYVASVQETSKQIIGNASCYRTERLIYDKDLWQNAESLVKKALDACGIRNGFSHTELFLLKDGSFRIIEINPRHSGARGLYNVLAKYHGLTTQVDLLTNYLHGKEIVESDINTIEGYGEVLFLYNFSSTPTKDIRPQLQNFHSVVQVIPCSKIGDIPRHEKDLTNIDCMLMLYDKHNKDLVIHEAEEIRKLEMSGHLL